MSKIIFEDVCIAARRLVESGERPSAPKIRKLLGDRGGMATIQKHLNGWRLTEEGKEADTPKIPEMPESLANDSHTLIQQIWGQAKASADLDILNEREKLALDRVDMEEKLSETIAVSEEQEAQIDELRGAVQDLHDKVSLLTESNDLHKSQLSDEITKNSILTERCDRLDKSLKAAEASVSHLDESLSTERSKREALAAEASKFEALADERAKSIANLQSQLAKLEKALSTGEERIAQLQEIATVEREKRESLADDASRFEALASEREKLIANQEAQLTKMDSINDGLSAELLQAAKERENTLRAQHSAALVASDERTTKLIEQLEKITAGIKNDESSKSKR